MNIKKVSVLTVAAFALVLTPLASAHVAAQINTTPQRLIVTFKDTVTEQRKVAVRNTGAQPVKELKLINGLVVNAPDKAVTNKLKALGNVKSVEIDGIASIAVRCSPWPSCKNQPTSPPPQTLPWGIDRVDAEKTWSASAGTGSKVAILDTGIDQTHPDLVDNIAGGINFVESGRGANVKVDPTAWNDDQGHGTHVAGTVAAANNTIGVVGVAPQARLYGVKVLDSNGNGYVSDIISGIEWSINNDIDVINMSLAETYHIQAFQDAVDLANNAGIVVVAAAGNVGDGNASTNEVQWPAKYSSVIAVSAIDTSDLVTTFSSDGVEVELAAPGRDVLSTTRGGGYGTMSGTSMATPHVAGLAASILATPITAQADLDQNGLWSNNEVRAHLQSTADDLGNVGRDVFYGYGLIDAEEAITGIVTQ